MTFLIIFFLLALPASSQEFRAPSVPAAPEGVPVAYEIIEEEVDPEILALENEIEERNKKIEDTEKEIEEISKQLDGISDKKRTLQSELDFIQLTNQRNKAQLNLTKDNIYRSQLKLRTLNQDITQSIKNIELLQQTLTDLVRRTNEYELRGDLYILFTDNSLFDILRNTEDSIRLSSALSEKVQNINNLRRGLVIDKDNTTKEKISLERLNLELVDRETILALSIQKQESILSETKNSEEEYQRLLKERLEERVGLQKELIEYESQLDFVLDPDLIPEARPGVLIWPIEGKIRLTQRFGMTNFAIRNRNHYGRPFHDGIDIATSINSSVLSASDGEVIAVGNTDLVRSCQSWGKWVAVKHKNGLTTLYTHLSLIKARPGQSVQRGELIAYSGNTGYSTGPHLHFGVYYSNGFKVIPYETVSASGRCRGLDVPVAATNAKLNPLDYLSSF